MDFFSLLKVKDTRPVFLFLSVYALLNIQCTSKSKPQISIKTAKDSISYLLQQTNDKSLSLDKRILLGKKAQEKAFQIQDDSLLLQSSFQLVKLYYRTNDSLAFTALYPKVLKQAQQSNSLYISAVIHNYIGFFYDNRQYYDSAYTHYYQSSKYYKKINDDFATGKMLLNMGIILKDMRDYIGSETTTVESLKYLLSSKNQRFIASAYNNLGIISRQLQKHSKAISYHKKAFEIRKKLTQNPILIIGSLNNIAVAYKDNKQYLKATSLLDSLLNKEKNLLKEHPKTHARLLDNLAHAQLLKGTLQGVLSKMERALSLRAQSQDLPGIMTSYLHLADYYRVIGEEAIAFEYARKAKDLSGSKKSYRDFLNALRFLSVSNHKDGTTYMEEYYRVSDSLEKAKNQISDHFARIRFEADEKEKANKRAQQTIFQQDRSLQVQTLIIILVSGIAILVATVLVLFWRNARFKQKLYQDFNHRTRNNLTAIQATVLKYKTRNHDDLNELEVLTNAQLLLYSQLEQSNHPTYLDLVEYIKIVTLSTIDIYQEFAVQTSFKMEPVRVSSKQASLLGRILSEFYTNAFKYGFFKTKENALKITLNRKRKGFHLVIEAKGKRWNPKHSEGKGQGMQLIKTMAKNIPAEVDVSYKNGITFLHLNSK